jgi:hypothetical protein
MDSGSELFKRLRALRLMVDVEQLGALGKTLNEVQHRIHALTLGVTRETTQFDHSAAHVAAHELSAATLMRSPCLSALKQLRVMAHAHIAHSILQHVSPLQTLESFWLELMSSSLQSLVPSNLSVLNSLPMLTRLQITSSAAAMVANTCTHPPIGPPPGHHAYDSELIAKDGGLDALQQLCVRHTEERLPKFEWQVPILEEHLLASPRSFVATSLLNAILSQLSSPETMGRMASSLPTLRDLVICDLKPGALVAEPWSRSLNDSLRKLDLRVQSMTHCEDALRLIAAADLSKLTTFYFDNPHVEVSAATTQRLCACLPALTDVKLGGMVMNVAAMESFGCLPRLTTVQALRLDKSQLALSLATAFPFCTSLNIEISVDEVHARTLLFSLPKLETYSVLDRPKRSLKDLKALCDADDLAALRRNAKAFSLEGGSSDKAATGPPGGPGVVMAGAFSAAPAWRAAEPADKANRSFMSPAKKGGRAHPKRAGLSAEGVGSASPAVAAAASNSPSLPSFSFGPTVPSPPDAANAASNSTSLASSATPFATSSSNPFSFSSPVGSASFSSAASSAAAPSSAFGASSAASPFSASTFQFTVAAPLGQSTPVFGASNPFALSPAKSDAPAAAAAPTAAFSWTPPAPSATATVGSNEPQHPLPPPVFAPVAASAVASPPSFAFSASPAVPAAGVEDVECLDQPAKRSR